MASYAPDQNSLRYRYRSSILTKYVLKILTKILSNPNHYSELHELSSEQMKTLRTTFELVCHLMHLGECTFLSQFCDSAYLFTGDLLRHFYSNGMAMKTVTIKGHLMRCHFVYIFLIEIFSGRVTA